MSDARERLAKAWTLAADGYEGYFEPRFAPWVRDAVNGLGDDLPDGPVLVPCCGTLPELAPLRAAAPTHQVVGIDLSPGMIERAAARVASDRAARATCADATDLTAVWRGAASAVVSTFGLQQLPDPPNALADWAQTLRPNGMLSVIYWLPRPEASGPFALMDDIIAGATPSADDDAWPDLLNAAVVATGAQVLQHGTTSHRIVHPDAQTFWNAMVDGGPLQSLALARGQEFVNRLGAEFVDRAPAGPLTHRPTAGLLIARRLP